jgi:hypothetical protein
MNLGSRWAYFMGIMMVVKKHQESKKINTSTIQEQLPPCYEDPKSLKIQ